MSPKKKDPKVIYTLTVLTVAKETFKKTTYLNTTRQRTWAWYSKREDAKRAVLSNATDVFEMGYYNFAVIEEMTEGLIPIAHNRWWFKAVYTGKGKTTKHRVTKIKDPDWTKNVINYGMG